ncbi:MAG: molybdopterin converting factor subunit 1 [Vicinamibacterales bacterium]
MRITILVFARLRDLVGAPRLVRDVPDGATVEQVWQALAAEFPAVAPGRAALSAAVNASYAKFPTPLAEGDEVAFLPPVSGG